MAWKFQDATMALTSEEWLLIYEALLCQELEAIDADDSAEAERCRDLAARVRDGASVRIRLRVKTKGSQMAKRRVEPQTSEVWILAPKPRVEDLVGGLHSSAEAADQVRREMGLAGRHLHVYQAQVTLDPEPKLPVVEASPSPRLADVMLYTDGSITKNPGGVGGWAFYATWGTFRANSYEASGAIPPPATNNISELQAVIEALRWAKGYFGAWNLTFCVVTDSRYVIDGFLEWLPGWKRRGWTNVQGTPVANRALWEQLEDAARGAAVRWEWVKGHSGCVENERADFLAGQAARAYQAKNILEVPGT